MPEIIRVRESRFRDDYSSDDERSSSYGHSRPGGYRTVQRYRVTPNHVEEVDDDRRTVRSERLEIAPRAERLEFDRRVDRVDRVDRIERELERPRSAIERPRSLLYEREYRDIEPEREREQERERTRTVVYERDRPREREREAVRPWERERERPWERERDIDVRIERRPKEEPTMELERYSRETEYYDRPDPTPPPIVIRQRAPEPQQIIVEAAKTPAPVVIPREEERYEEERQVARPAPRKEEEDYYYRRDVREVVERDDGRRDDHHDGFRDAAAGALATGAAAYGINKYRNRRRVSGSDSERSSGSEVVVRRERKAVKSRSHSPHHKRHLAEGALAGAGAAAIIANHRRKTGAGGDHKVGKVASGAALGAIGAELVTRARSRYRDKSTNRSRSSSRNSHSKLKIGLGLAAAAVAAAAAGKYVSNRNAREEELGRGRSRTRSVSRQRAYSTGDEDDYVEGKHLDPKHRKNTIAKAGAGAAIAAGVVEAIRARSRSRKGGRSQSRIRTGAAIAGTGLASAAIAGLYENRKAKKEEAELEQRGRRASRSRSRARSRSRSLAYSDPGADPELGMVEYGANPVYTTTDQRTAYNQGYYPDPAAADAAANGPRNRRSRSRSERRSRSRSRVRDLASGALATGAAAIGIDQYRKRKERKEAERERRRYEEEPPPENYYADGSYDDGYSPSPPRAAGGSYYPATNEFAPPPTAPPAAGGAAGFTHHPTTSTTHVNEYQPQPYNPADYAGQPPANTYGYPPVPKTGREGDNVSASEVPQSSTPESPVSQPQRRITHRLLDPDEEDRIVTPPSTATPSPIEEVPTKTVAFAPLSPTSSRRLARARKRRASDPSSDRPNTPSEHRRRHQNASRSPSPEVEVLPDRFDEDGRPLDAGSDAGVQGEMVEKVMRGFEDVLDGRASWKSLLSGLLDAPPDDRSSRHRRR
ncbi:MAG: hypothetical protein M1818_003402 [Claussenomyces sp. TS43310]|nr:MAG: hypothetical protein M1818_003402 [Claussenomyces sp. TS43310]